MLFVWYYILSVFPHNPGQHQGAAIVGHLLKPTRLQKVSIAELTSLLHLLCSAAVPLKVQAMTRVRRQSCILHLPCIVPLRNLTQREEVTKQTAVMGQGGGVPTCDGSPLVQNTYIPRFQTNVLSVQYVSPLLLD